MDDDHRARRGAGRNTQFGQAVAASASEGVDEVGQGRTQAGRSRYADKPDQIVRVENELPLDEPPPEQHASAAAEAEAGLIADHRGPEHGQTDDAVKLRPPAPSAWEAGIKAEDADGED